MNESTLVQQDKAASFAVAFEHARNDILQKFAPTKHTVHGVGLGAVAFCNGKEGKRETCL